MPLQTGNFDWEVAGAQRICTVLMAYDFETGEGDARQVSKTAIKMTFYQAHDPTDSYEDIATAIKNFAEAMFEEAAVEAAV